MITPKEARKKTKKSKDNFVKTFEKQNPSTILDIERSIIKGIENGNRYVRWDCLGVLPSSMKDIEDFLNYKGFTCERDFGVLIIRWL